MFYKKLSFTLLTLLIGIFLFANGEAHGPEIYCSDGAIANALGCITMQTSKWKRNGELLKY